MGQSTHKARPAQGREAVDESTHAVAKRAPAVRPAQAFRDCPGQVLSRRISRADAGRGRAKPVPRPTSPRRERPSRTVPGEQPVAALPMRDASWFGYPEKVWFVLLSHYTRPWPGITAPDCGSYGWKPVPRAASGAQKALGGGPLAWTHSSVLSVLRGSLPQGQARGRGCRGPKIGLSAVG